MYSTDILTLSRARKDILDGAGAILTIAKTQGGSSADTEQRELLSNVVDGHKSGESPAYPGAPVGRARNRAKRHLDKYCLVRYSLRRGSKRLSRGTRELRGGHG